MSVYRKFINKALESRGGVEDGHHDYPYECTFLNKIDYNCSDSEDEELPPPPPSPPHVVCDHQYNRILPSELHPVVRSTKDLSLSIVKMRKRKFLLRLDRHRLVVRSRIRQNRTATQFHLYVLLLKCFCSWGDFVHCRKKQISINRSLLRRVLLTWKIHADEQDQQQRGIAILERTTKIMQLRLERSVIQRWSDYCWVMRMQQKLFVGWKLLSRVVAYKRCLFHTNISVCIASHRKRIYFKRWRQYYLVRGYQETWKYIKLARIITEWKHVVHDELASEERLLRIATKRNIQRQKRQLFTIFYEFRNQISRKKRLVYLYLNLREKYHFKLTSSSFFIWKGYRILTFQQRRALSRVIRRRFLLQWKYIAHKMHSRQRTMLKIIIYRWWLFTENRKERRKINVAVRDHWSRYRYRLVMTTWRSITVREQGRIRTPRFLRRRESSAGEIYQSNSVDSGCKLQRSTYPKSFSCNVRNFTHCDRSSIDYSNWNDTKNDSLLAINSTIISPQLSVPFQRSSFSKSLGKNFSLGSPLPVSSNLPSKCRRLHESSTNRSTNSSSGGIINKMASIRDLDDSYKAIGEKKLKFDYQLPGHRGSYSRHSNQNLSRQTERSCFQSEASFSKTSGKLAWIDEAMSKAIHQVDKSYPRRKFTIAEEKKDCKFENLHGYKTTKGANRFASGLNVIDAKKKL